MRPIKNTIEDKAPGLKSPNLNWEDEDTTLVEYRTILCPRCNRMIIDVGHQTGEQILQEHLLHCEGGCSGNTYWVI